MTTCNSEYCPVMERCLRHVSNYPQGVFERVKTEDLEGNCENSDNANFIEMGKDNDK